MKLRATTLNDLVTEAGIYIDDLDYDDKARNAIINGNEALKALYEVLNQLDIFTADTVNNTVQKLVDESFEGKYGKVGMPFRAALTGRGNTPPVPSIAAVFGQEETLRRLKAAIDI